MVREIFCLIYVISDSVMEKVVSNPSVRSGEKTLQQLYDVVNSCGVRIIYNDQELTQLTISDLEMLFFTDTSHKNKKSTCIPLQEVLKDLSLEDKEIDILTSRELYKTFSRLKDEKESFLEADKGYQSLKRKALYYDSHSRPKVFNNPRVNSKTIKASAYEIDFSAKPDGIHYYFPSYLEIKGKEATHLECLTKGLNRILASISPYGLFAKHFVFVVENSFSFIIFCDLQRSGNPVISVSLVSLAPSKYRNELQQHRNPINVHWSFDDDVVMLCEYASSKGISIKYEHHHHI